MSGFISPPPGQELPPRTRRIPRRCRRRPDRPGTTSAYAENTAASGLNPGRARNYLRVRGEYADLNKDLFDAGELPPRTRRIQSHQNDYRMNGGTTSAYAENTQTTPPPPPRWNYLRVRGEYTWSPNCFLYTKELPPRTRRIHPQRYRLLGGGGTTSAYAENTPERGHDFIPRRNYLRVRGEYISNLIR